jgi:hypothetical protein
VLEPVMDFKSEILFLIDLLEDSKEYLTEETKEEINKTIQELLKQYRNPRYIYKCEGDVRHGI